MDANNSELFRTDYSAWIRWRLAQPGKYATAAEAQAAADAQNAERVRDVVWYSPMPNRNGGFDVGMASCDG